MNESHNMASIKVGWVGHCCNSYMTWASVMYEGMFHAGNVSIITNSAKVVKVCSGNERDVPSHLWFVVKQNTEVASRSIL